MKTLKILIVVLLLAVLIVGAYVLYSKLAPMMDVGGLQTAATQSQDGPQESQEPEKTAAPDFTLHDVDGNTSKLSDFQGKPVILNFWASGCTPCKMEMPDFQRKFETYGEDIHFLIVNMTDGKRETLEKASKFIEDNGFTFPVYYDVEQEAAYTYGVMSLPTTYFIDAEGYLVAQGRGTLSADALQNGIDMLLGS